MDDTARTQRRILSRLRRIEGQIRGLQRMIEEGRDCADVVTQTAAARRALDQVGFVILSHRIEECVRRKADAGADGRPTLEELMRLFLKLA